VRREARRQEVARESVVCVRSIDSEADRTRVLLLLCVAPTMKAVLLLLVVALVGVVAGTCWLYA